MVIRRVIVMISLMVLLQNLLGQTVEQESLDAKLQSFLIKRGEMRIDTSFGFIKIPQIYKLNLIDSNDKKTVAVYFFRIMSSTSKPYLCLRGSDGNITFIENYHIDDCLSELLNFYRQNNKYITSSEKIRCTEQALMVIKTWEQWVDEIRQGRTITK